MQDADVCTHLGAENIDENRRAPNIPRPPVMDNNRQAQRNVSTERRMVSRNIAEMTSNRPTPHAVDLPADEFSSLIDLGHGDVLIAAITSCTNTSNPSVLLAAGLLAKKAVEKGLSVKRHIKTSLAPGSRVR